MNIAKAVLLVIASLLILFSISITTVGSSTVCNVNFVPFLIGIAVLILTLKRS